MHWIIAFVWWSLLGLTLEYLLDLCCPRKSALGLCSTEQGIHNIPFALTTIKESCSISVIGPHCEATSHWCLTCSPGLALTLFFILTSKLFISAMPGSGVLLNTSLEGALYKCL